MRKREIVSRIFGIGVVFIMIGLTFLGGSGTVNAAEDDTTPPEVSIPYAIPEGEVLPSDFSVLATDIEVIVDEIRDTESGISSVTLAYIWPGTVGMKQVDMYRSPTPSLPDRYVGLIECHEGWPLDNPLPWYYTGIGVLQYAVEATNGEGLSTAQFPLKHINLDISIDAQTDARIVRPSIGFPVIQVSDGTFTITMTSEQELPTESSSWDVKIAKGIRNIIVEDENTFDNGTDYYITIPLTAEHVSCDNEYWYSITVRIPTDTPENLYDLEVEVDGQSYSQENAVQVIESFSSQPTFYILTDPHIGFSGHPKIPELWEEDPNIDEMEIFQREIEAINLIHPDFVILSGDLVDWSSADNWEDFENLLKIFEVPVYTLVGNHDYYKDDWWSHLPGGFFYRSRLHALDDYLENINSYLNYSFDYGPFHMVCLDSGHDTEPNAAGSGLYDWQIGWLQSDLDGHPDSFIFMHHPTISTNSFECITKNVDLFKDICSARKVCAVFNGHSHQNESHSYGGVDYHHTTSATKGDEVNGYRMIRATGAGSYETMSLDDWDEFWGDYNLALMYSPVEWDAGTEETVTATIQNRHTGKAALSSPLFSDMFLKFIMPAGTYNVSAVTAPSVWSPEAKVTDCEIVAKIDWGDKSIYYVTVEVRDAEPTQFYDHWEYLTTVVVTLTNKEPKEDVPVDAYLLVDLSGSFADDLPVFKTQAPNMIADLKTSYPDIRFGLGKFEDYPIWPFGDAASGDKAYERLIDLTFDMDSVLSTIAGLYTRYGADGPQSQLPALYQAATGAGQDLSGVGYPGASIPAGQQANFRDGATKLFLLWTDASFHQPGDPGDIPYPGPSFDETVDAILGLDPPMVIGISSGGGGLADLEAIAIATGALAPFGGIDIDGDGTVDIAEGEPLVATIGYSGQGIAAAIESLVEAAAVLPIADAGGPYTGEVGKPIIFDGSNSFDADGWVMLYEWDFESDGIFDFVSAEPTAEHTYSAEFSDVVTLRVTDNDANVGTDMSPVEVLLPPNQPPVADAGPDQTIFAIPPATTAMVTLDGSGSYDPDGDPLTYTWSWGSNSAYGVNPTVELPPGTTTITLVVNDGQVDSEPDALNVTILLQATMDFDPDVFNLRSLGKVVTAYIELPEGFDASQIDISSIKLNDTVPALTKPTQIGDYDKDGIPDLMVKFDRKAVQAVVEAGESVEVTVTGEVDGIQFTGTDTIRVIHP